MKRLILLGTLLAAFALTGVIQAMPQPAPTVGAQAVAGEYLIKFAPGASQAHRQAAINSVGGKATKRIDALNIEVVQFPAIANGANRQSEGHVLAALGNNPQIEFIQPNYRYTADATGGRTVYLPQVSGINDGAPFTPNDTYLSSQYAWSKIGAFQGWGYTQGSSDVVVAVIDTSIQLEHPDLIGKTVAGYDFIDYDDEPGFVDDNNYYHDQEEGHGTHVAGIVAASTNNGTGIAGTCPNCKVMPVRVLDNSGSGTTSGVTDGIIYAADHGAKVINLSLGGPDTDEAMEAAINYAWDKGVVVACAAGNEGVTRESYPAASDNCIAVGATDSQDRHAYYSQHGMWVDIVAPGSDIYSTWTGSAYKSISGTSMATPHVAGTAGLLASKGLTNQQIRDRLQSSADPINGTGTYWNNGRLNVERALSSN